MKWRFIALFVILHSCAAWDLASAQEQETAAKHNVQIIRTREATVVVLSGVGPVDKKGKLVAPDDFAGQFKQTWENMRLLAAGAGSPIENIVSMTVTMTDPKWQEEFSKMQGETFNNWYPPTTFAVSSELKTPGALLEIHAVAIIQERRKR